MCMGKMVKEEEEEEEEEEEMFDISEGDPTQGHEIFAETRCRGAIVPCSVGRLTLCAPNSLQHPNTTTTFLSSSLDFPSHLHPPYSSFPSFPSLALAHLPPTTCVYAPD